MAPATFPSRLRLLSTSFRYADSRFFYGRADLYFDRIELLGWGGGRTGRVVLPLASIEHVEHDDSARSPRTIFHLDDGQLIALTLKKPDLWKRYLTSRLEWRTRLEGKSRVPDEGANWSMKDLINYSTSMS